MMTDTSVRDDSTRLLLNAAAQERRRFDRTRLLRSAGYAVIEAASESQAISTVVHRDVDVAVLDGDLPGCDLGALGETLQRMRPDMAVVVVPAPEMHIRWPRDQIAIHDGDGRQLIDAVGTALRKDHQRNDSSDDPEVVTDVDGRIRGTSDHGARLLNGSARGLLQRNLINFFDAPRDVWHDAVRRARAGESVQSMGRLRPKERKPVDVNVRIMMRTGAAGVMLEWAIDPSCPEAPLAPARTAGFNGGSHMRSVPRSTKRAADSAGE